MHDLHTMSPPLIRISTFPSESTPRAAEAYRALKVRAYVLAEAVTGISNNDAVHAGYKDVFHCLMSDGALGRQTSFERLIGETMSARDQKLLLDGMAREYAGLGNWNQYISMEAA